MFSSPVQTVKWDIRFQIEGKVYAALGRPQSLGLVGRLQLLKLDHVLSNGSLCVSGGQK